MSLLPLHPTLLGHSVGFPCAHAQWLCSSSRSHRWALVQGEANHSSLCLGHTLGIQHPYRSQRLESRVLICRCISIAALCYYVPAAARISGSVSVHVFPRTPTNRLFACIPLRFSEHPCMSVSYKLQTEGHFNSVPAQPVVTWLLIRHLLGDNRSLRT